MFVWKYAPDPTLLHHYYYDYDYNLKKNNPYKQTNKQTKDNVKVGVEE